VRHLLLASALVLAALPASAQSIYDNDSSRRSSGSSYSYDNDRPRATDQELQRRERDAMISAQPRDGRDTLLRQFESGGSRGGLRMR
jgi:hypothetical protein